MPHLKSRRNTKKRLDFRYIQVVFYEIDLEICEIVVDNETEHTHICVICMYLSKQVNRSHICILFIVYSNNSYTEE